MRDARGMQSKALSHTVEYKGAGRYEVTSGESGKTYTVQALEQGGATCTCDWGWHRRSGQPCVCSHVIAAVLDNAKRNGLKLVTANSVEEAEWKAEELSGKASELGDGVWMAYAQA